MGQKVPRKCPHKDSKHPPFSSHRILSKPKTTSQEEEKKTKLHTKVRSSLKLLHFHHHLYSFSLLYRTASGLSSALSLSGSSPSSSSSVQWIVKEAIKRSASSRRHSSPCNRRDSPRMVRRETSACRIRWREWSRRRRKMRGGGGRGSSFFCS